MFALISIFLKDLMIGDLMRSFGIEALDTGGLERWKLFWNFDG